MAEQRSDDLVRSRQEAALLLRLDPENLSPADVLRCDLVASLRLVVDDASATVLDGRAPDLARLLTATETLIKLLPAEPKPESRQHGDDPRQVLLQIIMEGRERAALGFEGYDGKVRQVEALQAEVAALKAQLAGGPAPAPLDVPTSDIVPPGEYLGVPPMRGPDDPRPPRPTIIEGKAVPKPSSAPAAPAAPQYDYSKSQDWKNWIEPDGSIRTTPRGPGRYWGPV